MEDFWNTDISMSDLWPLYVDMMPCLTAGWVGKPSTGSIHNIDVEGIIVYLAKDDMDQKLLK